MPFRFPVAPAQVVDLFREFYGPTKRAFDRLDTREQQGLHEALTKLWSEHNLARDGSTYVESEYLEVIANKA